MTLADLKEGQTVRCRHGRAGESRVNWCPWHDAKILYLRRREVDLPARLRKRAWRGEAWKAGAIITLVVEGWSAEYSQADFFDGTFTAEDWYLEIEGLTK